MFFDYIKFQDLKYLLLHYDFKLNYFKPSLLYICIAELAPPKHFEF